MRYIPRLSRSVYLILILVGASLCPLHVLAGPAIVLASTTSVEDSGLLGRILPLFTKTTGIEVRGVAQGTGQALETARARRCRPRAGARPGGRAEVHQRGLRRGP